MVSAASIKTILKKSFSIALIFNSLISVAAVAGIIYGYYHAYPHWKPYWPFLLNGNIFWLALVAALVNIFPGAAIGRALHTGRFLVHHYVYGFFVLASTTALVGVYTGLNVISIFFIDSNAVAVNAGRCFFLAGLALFLDDLPDVHRHVERSLNWIKHGACRVRKPLHIAQIITGAFAFYCALSILLSTLQNSARWLPNSFVIVSLFITAITSFALAKRGAWLRITRPEAQQAIATKLSD